MHKIYIDDTRLHEGLTGDWTLVRTYEDFKNLLEGILDTAEEWIEIVSFDYDLSATEQQHNGVDCMLLLFSYLKKYGLPCPTLEAHSYCYNSMFNAPIDRFVRETEIYVPPLCTNSAIY